MTPEEIANFLAEHHKQILQAVKNMDPVTAHKLLIRMVEKNDPPGLWQHIGARGYVQLPVEEDSDPGGIKV
jgi:hypothetical protein